MIYSKDDVLKMLKAIEEMLDNHRKCRPHDCDYVRDKINEIKRGVEGPIV